ncbi:hypothetical protein [Streptomyces nitrosporeus]|uniref:hypothetical protein n=1 Tax=Streptomyces nitrosporeus TaxID=28894 RepID=UPI00167C6965|nr:hypothetical protein [Streptomyces nitrosporeus]GGZ20077.1 hypothetical protein GCM10010327_59100 [Streptomyces nitrosporeus]
MTTETSGNGALTPRSKLSRAIQAAGILTALLATAGILVLAVTGQSENIPAVAGLGLAGGATPITVNVIRNGHSRNREP